MYFPRICLSNQIHPKLGGLETGRCQYVSLLAIWEMEVLVGCWHQQLQRPGFQAVAGMFPSMDELTGYIKDILPLCFCCCFLFPPPPPFLSVGFCGSSANIARTDCESVAQKHEMVFGTLALLTHLSMDFVPFGAAAQKGASPRQGSVCRYFWGFGQFLET